jgi:hypothetical protein
MEEACRDKSPGGSQKAVGKWGAKGCPLGSFLGSFLGNAKKEHKKANRERAKLGERLAT